MSDSCLWYLEPIVVSAADRKRFADGILAVEWYEQYGPVGLFDEHCLSNAESQGRTHHFVEWATVVHYFNTYQWLSLNQQYRFNKHKRKNDILHEIAPPEVVEVVENPQYYVGRKTEPPDLFVYSSDKTMWRFVDVKRIDTGDKPSDEQMEYWSIISQASSQPVYVQPVEVR